MAHVGIMTSGGNLCASQKSEGTSSTRLRKRIRVAACPNLFRGAVTTTIPGSAHQVHYLVKKRAEKEKLGCSEANPKKCVLTKASESSDRGVLVAQDCNNNHGVLD